MSTKSKVPSKPGRKPGTKKTGGRKAGTPNKLTKDQKGFIAELLETNRANYAQRLLNLDDDAFCANYIKLMEFITPKCKAVDIDIKADKKTFKEELEDIYAEDI